MHTRTALTISILSLLGVTALTGCVPEKQSTQVSLLNRTQNELTARVVLHNLSSPDQTLARRALLPGQTTVMGPFPPHSRGSIELVLHRDNQFSEAPSRQSLSPGFSAWQVVTPVFTTYSAIELRPVEDIDDEPEWTSVPAGCGHTRRGPTPGSH